MKKGLFIAIDVGTFKNGWAASDLLCSVAIPMGCFRPKDDCREFHRFKAFVNNNHILGCVFGLPAAQKCGLFYQHVSLTENWLLHQFKHLKLGSIHFQDERFTSFNAKKRNKVCDSVSASFILQEYLDHKRKNICINSRE